MISIELLQRQSQHLQSKLDDYLKTRVKGDPYDREAKKLAGQISYRRDLIRYLEGNPSEESVRKQLDLVDKKIKLIEVKISNAMSQYQHEGLRKKMVSEIKAAERYSVLKEQRNTLEFILK